jgi:antitoxin component of MazEF toxin-antitoxin module
MIKSLQKVGNSRALVLDKAMLEHLGVRDEDQVQVTLSGDSLIVTGVSRTIPDDVYERSKKKIMTKYDKMLRNLAK